MQESLFGTTTVTDEVGHGHTFSYWLITQQIPAGPFSFEDYGVRISSGSGESACLPSLTHSCRLIQHLLTLLLEYAVSPTGLYDVAVD